MTLGTPGLWTYEANEV
jgi:hypothetical protein